jgi:hypothetical protein
MDSFNLKNWFISAAFGVVVILSAVLCAGCNRPRTSSSLTSDEAAATTNAVRAFATSVADDVTRRGPLAWSDHFENTPNFFMASNGQLVFANGEAAIRGIKDVPKFIAHIELRWGDPMLVDPLAPTLAIIGAPYHEVQVDPSGHQIEENGYFTGLAELGPAGWKFRNAHWSVTPPTAGR